MGKSVFNASWLTDAAFQPWLAAVQGDPRAFYCTYCKKRGSLGKMGKKAVESHASSGTHKKAKSAVARITPLFSFSGPSTSSSTQNAVSGSSNSVCSSASSATNVAVSVEDLSEASAEATKAAVIWTLRTVYSHQSFSSNDNIGEILKAMFPSCNALKVFTCGQDKTAYVAKHGLAPFFKDSLREKFLTRAPFTLLFDESLNKVTKNKQLDVHVIFWDGDLVKTRYYGSAFLSHSRTDDLLKHFKVQLILLNYPK